ncbi:isopentenyl-diphosphate Delta-isomerase [Fibrobacterales bacterium]|nr:isopentenyl-diphosphate Delta-isomerase [Fibrobacterales bacterium]
MRELHNRLLKMNGKPYGVYKSLQGQYWNFGDFTLKFTHIQGDPHAQPSRVKLTAKLAELGFEEDLYKTEEKAIALSDFLLRGFSNCVGVGIVVPHSQIMVRNSLCIENGLVSLLASVNLPGESRRIDGEAASQLLVGTLADYVTTAMYFNNLNKEKLLAHIECYENRNYLQSQLKNLGLVAFVPNGAVLPRASGTSESPLENAVIFESPKELEVELKLRHCLNKGEGGVEKGEGNITGMGIPRGITVIAGGGFHGKSTLLHALEEAVYAHIPGDGREFVVVDETATPIKTEEGRVVNGTSISALVRQLPFQKSTENFSTKNASGATSQAANLLEAVELGTKTLLIDEDASAVNFLIRDLRMRELINAKNEPLIPLTDKIREFSASGLNFIIVVGACGDYLALADTVIAFTEYKAECLTERARQISDCVVEPNVVPEKMPMRNINPDYWVSLKIALKPTSTIEKNVKIRVNAGQISIGQLKIDLRKFPTYCNLELQRGIAFLLHSLLNYNSEVVENKSLYEVLNSLCKSLPAEETFDLALPRIMEVGAAFLRINSEEYYK